MKASGYLITVCSFSFRYIINKLRVFNAGRLSAAPPKTNSKIEFWLSFVSGGRTNASVPTWAVKNAALESVRENSVVPLGLYLNFDCRPSDESLG